MSSCRIDFGKKKPQRFIMQPNNNNNNNITKQLHNVLSTHLTFFKE